VSFLTYALMTTSLFLLEESEIVISFLLLILFLCSSEVIIWDRHSGKMLRRLVGHTSDVKCVDILSDSTSLISGSYDNKAICWKFTMPSSAQISAEEEADDEKA
jgi:WD40 repeat protein